MKIGIFDSGIGGLSLLSELCARVEGAGFIYYADSKNAPYGEKSEGEIVALSERVALELMSRGADAIAIACNTATAAAAKYLRAKYRDIAIFGMEPAIYEAASKIKDGRILAAATPLTLKGEKYNALLDRTGASLRISSLPMPKLVRLAERDLFYGRLQKCPDAEIYIKEEFAKAGIEPDKLSAVVLGCTHFVYFKESFRNLLPAECPVFDGVRGTASHVIRTLGLCERSSATTSAEEIMSITEFSISGEAPDENTTAGIENCLSLLCKARNGK